MKRLVLGLLCVFAFAGQEAILLAQRKACPQKKVKQKRYEKRKRMIDTCIQMFGRRPQLRT